jgi:antitoxin ParD1/3/4
MSLLCRFCRPERLTAFNVEKAQAGKGLSLTNSPRRTRVPQQTNKLLLLAIFASRAMVNSKSTSMGRASVMPTRNVNLTDELDRFVAKKVKTGRYENASEVVRAGLRTLEREEQQYEAKIAALKAAIDAGDASGIAEGNVFGRVRKALKLPVSPR